MPFNQGQHDCSSGAKSATGALKVSCCFLVPLGGRGETPV